MRGIAPVGALRGACRGVVQPATVFVVGGVLLLYPRIEESNKVVGPFLADCQHLLGENLVAAACKAVDGFGAAGRLCADRFFGAVIYIVGIFDDCAL